MPAPDVPALAAEILELSRDGLEAARVARLCRLAAGQRLMAIRGSMSARAFETWVYSDACPVLPSTASAWCALAAAHAARELANEPQ